MEKKVIIMVVIICLLISIGGLAFFINCNFKNNKIKVNADEEILWQKNVKGYSVNELTNGYYIKSDNKFYPLISMEELASENNFLISNFSTSRYKDSEYYGLYSLFFLNTSYENNIPHIRLDNKEEKIVFVGEKIPSKVILKNVINLEVDKENFESEEDFDLSNLKIGTNPTVLQKGTKTKEIMLGFATMGTYTDDYTVTKDGYMEINFEQNDCGRGMYMIGDKVFFIEQNNDDANNVVKKDIQEQLNLANLLNTIEEKKKEIENLYPSFTSKKSATFFYDLKEGTPTYSVDTNDGLSVALRKGIKILPEQIPLYKDFKESLPQYGFDSWGDQIGTKIIEGTRYYFFSNVNKAFAIKASDYYDALMTAIKSGGFKIY